MEQYILKSAIVAELERRKSQFMSQADDFHSLGMEEKRDHFAILASNMHSILSFLDTLDAKEVDIRNEVSNWWNNHYASCYAGIKKDYTFEGYAGHYLDNSTIINLAQYFYELGLKIKGVK